MEPIIQRYEGGEYSTVLLPDGVIETVWFDDDGSSRVVARTPLSAIARRHVAICRGTY